MAVEFPVIDFSYSKLTDAELAQFKAAGGTGCACYGGKNVNPDKVATKAYVEKVWSHDLDIIPIFEDNANDYLMGAARGLECGLAARAGWRELGLPDDWPIIFGGFDTGAQTNPANWPTCFAFMDNFNKGCAMGNPPMPAYVGTVLGEQLIARGLISWIWFPAATSWSTGVGITPNVNMQQTLFQPYPFINVPPGEKPRYDANRVLKPFYAQYPGGAMPIDNNDVLKIVNGTWMWGIPNPATPPVGSAQARLINAEAKAAQALIAVNQMRAVVDAMNVTLGSIVNAVNVGNQNDLLRDNQLKQAIADLSAQVAAIPVTTAQIQQAVKNEMNGSIVNLQGTLTT